MTDKRAPERRRPHEVLDLSDRSQLDLADPDARSAVLTEFVNAMFVFLKSSLLYDLNNPTLHGACTRMATVSTFIYTNFDGSAEMRFRYDGIYVNESLLKFQVAGFEQAEYVSKVWGALEIAAVRVEKPCDHAHWMDVAEALRQYIRGESPLWRLSEFPHGHVILEAPGQQEAQQKTAGDRYRLTKRYAVLAVALGEFYKDMLAERRPCLASVKRPLFDLVEEASDCRDLLMGLTQSRPHQVGEHFRSANAALVATVIGAELGIDRPALGELALAALLCDLGGALARLRLPGETRSREQDIADTVQALVTLGCGREYARRFAVAAEWAGNGPSRGVSSRIVQVAMAYIRLTSVDGERPGLLPDEAVRVLQSRAGHEFDEAVVRVFVNAVGIFPVGSLVQLSDGHMAAILSVPVASDPARPRVRLLVDQGGAMVDREVDLGLGDSREVLHCLDPGVAGLNLPAYLL